MTINKIYISAFGGLKDYTLELNDGFNVIHGENENGKSTVMAFVKMMFYGSGRKSSDINKNLRMKYKPWDGGIMGGRIYFEHGGRRYCLEREFKSNDSSDRIALRDLDFGSNVPIAVSDIGTRFFGLSDAAFERCAFINGTGVFLSDADSGSELNAKLSNTVTTGDESTSYELIKKRIVSAVNELVTVKHVGKYDKGLARLEELKAEYEKADAAAKARNELAEKIVVLKKQLTDTKSEYDRVKAIVDSENDIRNAEKLQEYLNTKKQLDELNGKLVLNDGGHVDSMFIGKVNFCLSKFDTENHRAKEKQNEITELEKNIRIAEENMSKADPAYLEKLQLQVEALENEKGSFPQKYSAANEQINTAQADYDKALNARRPFNPVFLGLGIALVIAAVTAFVFNQTIPAIASAVIGAVLLVLGFVIRPQNKEAQLKTYAALTEAKHSLTELEAQKNELESKINKLLSEINVLTVALNTDTALIEHQKEELEAQNASLEKINEQRESALAELTALYARFKPTVDPEEIRSQLKELGTHTEEQKNIKLRLKYLSSDLGNISYEAAAEKLASLSDSASEASIDFKAAHSELETLNQRGINLSTVLSSAITELKNELKNAVEPEDIMREINELTATLDEQKKFLDAANVAAEVLEDSYAELHGSYSSALENRTLEIFSQLTDGKYNNINVSDKLQLQTEESGIFGTRSIEYLSSGTIDQAYLSLRLALCELITDGERLPVMLDDALSQYDDTRAATALSFLKNYSKDAQIILFTCHNSIFNSADSLGAHTQKFGSVLNVGDK